MFFPVGRIRKILEELKDNVYRQSQPVNGYRVKECGYGDFDLLQEDPASWRLFGDDESWGGRDTHCWFKTTVQLPESYAGRTVVYRVGSDREGWDATNPQFLVFVNGKVEQGLDVNHQEVFLTDCAKAGETFDIALYAYGGMQPQSSKLRSQISVLQEDVEKLYYHINVPLEVADLLDEQDKRRLDILQYLTNAINMLDLRRTDREAFFASVAQATAYLEEEFYGKYCGKEDVTEVCIGHTHIDVAWLWTLAQTREKAARSFTTVLSLMKRYPEYVFMSSQPQLYQFVKEDHPEIYEQIKERIQEGRWEPEGAMWLEADCNLTSGESLVRQILYGKRFFQDEFGVDNKILWLPDVFGYSAALPQILKKSGVDYFMTTKISWNEFNKLPYDTFMWQGIDGTEILTHFISTKEYQKGGEVTNFTSYNGNINASEVMGCWQRYQQKEINPEVLNCFGHGDGGGGPTRAMLENARRLQKGIPGAPRVKMETSGQFFRELEQRVKDNRHLPKWVGELYLEFHRATYTSQAQNKKYNRQAEFANLAAEWGGVMNSALLNGAYPQKELNDCWRTTMLNQFHDIIPGSSIKEVYEDSEKQYLEMRAVTDRINGEQFSALAGALKLDETSVVVFNQLSFARSDVVSFRLPDGWQNARVFDGQKELNSQPVGNGELLFFAEDVPAKGYKAFTIRQSSEGCAACGMTVSTDAMENEFFRLTFDNEGCITSLFDKQNNRQVLQAGQRANVLQAFEDKPTQWDAWNVDIFYQEKMWEINDVVDIRVTENGPVRCALTITKKFLESTVEQTIYLYHQIGRIDFANVIDWKEHQVFVKAAFPVDVHADKASYEIQYGNVERPTHWNTSWDWARYEVCAHKWADLSEGGYGVSLLNDCKYGYDIKDSVMRLSLIKSGIYPDEHADQKVHRFTYSLYPHAQDWKQAGTVQMAYSLNCPMYAVVQPAHDGVLPACFSLISTDCSNVCVEVVKKAEDSNDIIIRLYEFENKRSNVTCALGIPFASVSECDLMEKPISQVDGQGQSFSFTIKPYEIKTFAVRLS